MSILIMKFSTKEVAKNISDRPKMAIPLLHFYFAKSLEYYFNLLIKNDYMVVIDEACY